MKLFSKFKNNVNDAFDNAKTSYKLKRLWAKEVCDDFFGVTKK